MFRKRECRSVSRLFWDYAASRLSADETERVERHLQRCAICQAEAEEHRQAVHLLAVYREQAVPESRTSWRALRSRLEAEERSASAPLRWPRWAAAWGGAVAVLLFALAARHTPRAASTNSSPSSGTPPNIIAQGDLPSTGDQQTKTVRVDPPDSGSVAGQNTRLVQAPTPADDNGASVNRPQDKSARKPRRHRPVWKRAPRRVPTEHPSEPQPDSSPIRLTNYPDPVDGPANRPPQREFVLSPALLPSSQGPPRHYVMDSIPLSSHNIRQASFEREAEEIDAW